MYQLVLSGCQVTIAAGHFFNVIRANRGAMSGILKSNYRVQEASMTDLRLPANMADLRPALGGIVAQARERAPYFTVLLSSKQGLTLQIDNGEQDVIERAPSAGTVLSAFDGRTIYERAISGFHQDEVQ